MTDSQSVTSERKEAARSHVHSAIQILDLPSGSSFPKPGDALVPLTEKNRRAAVKQLLQAIECLVPPDHPDAHFAGTLSAWINS